VFNKFEAQANFETALDKATEGNLDNIAREISKDLVRVYQLIAIEYDEKGEAELSLQFFEKCLEMAHRVHDTDKEAECYQQIANIYERNGEMNNAIDYLQKFLEISIESKNNEKQTQAYKRLSECESKNGNTTKAIEYLGAVLKIANNIPSRSAQAEATLGMGLLYNQAGRDHNIKKAAEYLDSHFQLLRQEQPLNQSSIDSARVSIGIVQANQKIDAYKYMVLNNL
jgi:tetratricopeptide (TPR) repeat protein